MSFGILRKILGTRNDRIVKSFKPLVEKVNSLEPKYEKMSDEELKDQTRIFKERLAKGETLNDIEAEAFAVVREASKRTIGLRHFDVQLIGGAVLHSGAIAEMKTGEGKTLVATLAAYLNALPGKGVHVVTVNDYLAKRDTEWMGRIYRFLGLTVGCVYSGMDEDAKREAYKCDITYGQNNEFGFDYLRDNMKFSKDDLMQRGHFYAIVDEVDSILIDEARTPLIISGPAEDSTELYISINMIIPKLNGEKDYKIDLQSKTPTLTEDGIKHVEELLSLDNLYDPKNIDIVHHVGQALRAHLTMKRDSDYVVKDGEVIIVDEFTGRLMPGRRWSNGLHQAVEAKEGVPVRRENQTLATITFQNLFRMYEKLSGMTGTADTEAMEFKEIYRLNVVTIPTNMPLIRDDQSDVIYRTREEKYNAVVDDIQEIHKTGQPILVGTITIEQSETISKMLKDKGIEHKVLNAKHHEKEAEIVAQAGRFGAVTISTNMAGRGTDIMLGGNPEFLAMEKAGTRDKEDPGFKAALEEFKVICEEEKEKVKKAGGLFIMGTERHESRRIDNQLRGRAGRQGDPGVSRFYVSLSDDLMKRFGGEKIQAFMSRLGWTEGLAMDGRILSRQIEGTQQKVERIHFDARKHITEYDDVMNKQRQVIYNLRSKILFNDDIREEIFGMIDDLIEDSIQNSFDDITKKNPTINYDELSKRIEFLFNQKFELNKDLDLQGLFDDIRNKAKAIYLDRVAILNEKFKALENLKTSDGESLNIRISESDNKELSFETVEQDTLLELLDHFWNEHLQAMDDLREGIGLRGYGQLNPLHEYQKEGFLLFKALIANLRETLIRRLYMYEVPDPAVLIAEIEAEQARRERIEEVMRMNSNNEEDDDEKFPKFGKAKRDELRKLRRKNKK
ncbi:MAG: preprotein translocase subunit SecA [Bdellovibrionota bacterium]|nr:preprotein translocase subunit SecA [Bdellovibrionota bacterium]